MINKVLVINKTNIVVQYYLYTEAQKLDHLLKKQRQLSLSFNYFLRLMHPYGKSG